MGEQLQLLDAAAPATWTAPKGQGKCRRDPAAGPGSCWFWWEGCPKAEQRGCYLAWARQTAQADQ